MTIYALLAAAALAAPSGPEPSADGASPLTLARALRLAAENHEEPHRVAADVDRARAQLRGAWARLLPSLSATYTHRTGSFTGGGSGSFSFFFAGGGQLAAGAQLDLLDASAITLIRAADDDLEAARWDAREAVRQLEFEVAATFLAVLAAERLEGAAVQRVEVARHAVEVSEQRLAAGLIRGNAVTRTRLELASAELTRTQAHTLTVTSRLSLSYLIGVPVVTPLAEPGVEAIATADAAAAPERALADRPDLKAARARVMAAHDRTWEPWMRLVPSVMVAAEARESVDALRDGQEPGWQVLATVAWPLYDGGLRYADAMARDAEMRRAQLAQRGLERSIPLELQRSLSEIENHRAAVQQGSTRVEVAAQNAAEVDLRFANGLATALEVADASSTAFEAAAELERQRLALSLAHINLLRALGRDVSSVTVLDVPGGEGAIERVGVPQDPGGE